MPKGPLNGVTVIDMTRVLAGPYCTMLLLDLGARVIKVERPGQGDEARGIGPFLGPVSGYFASVNRGKESIALDLAQERDRSVLSALLAGADVLVENFRPGVMERLGLGWPALHAQHPGLIYASCSGFGQTGPYRQRPAYDMVVQAMGGIMSLTGHPGVPPTRVGSSIGDLAAALFTAIGVLAALYHRTQTGQGQAIDVAMLDCQVALLENAIARYGATGQAPGPLGARHPSIAPFDAFRTGDGHVVVAAANDGLFRRLCSALDRPAMAGDARYASNALRVRHADALRDQLEAALRQQPSRHWLAVLEQAGVPCGAIADVAAVMADPQVEARNMVVACDGGEAGPIRLAGNPVKLSAFDDPATRGAVPGLDEHRAKLLDEFKIKA